MEKKNEQQREGEEMKLNERSGLTHDFIHLVCVEVKKRIRHTC